MLLNMQDLISCIQMDISVLMFKTDLAPFKTYEAYFSSCFGNGSSGTGMCKM